MMLLSTRRTLKNNATSELILVLFDKHEKSRHFSSFSSSLVCETGFLFSRAYNNITNHCCSLSTNSRRRAVFPSAHRMNYLLSPFKMVDFELIFFLAVFLHWLPLASNQMKPFKENGWMMSYRMRSFVMSSPHEDDPHWRSTSVTDDDIKYK